MAQRYYGTSGKDSALLDELLCEYVDGTIDQVVQAAFDECMSADKSLAERVECLRRTRRLLKQHRCRESRGVHLRVRERLCRELNALQEDGAVLRSLSPFLGAGAILALVLCAMLITGDTGQEPPSPAYNRGTPPAPAVVGSVPMTPLRGPEPVVPVRLAVGPPLAQVSAREASP